MKVTHAIHKIPEDTYDLIKDQVLHNIVESWFDCSKTGKIWSVGRDKIVGGCLHKYVDIRKLINARPTIKGIALNIHEWKILMTRINEINKFMGIKVFCTKLKTLKENQT